MLIQDKMNIKTAVRMYTFAKLFNLPGVHIAAFIYIERCFTMVVETQDFLNLDHTFVSRILTSSCLHIDSELEVYDAANAWLTYNVKDRKKVAKDLLLTVRLPLLSHRTLKYLLDKCSTIFKIDECVEVLNKVLYGSDSLYQNKSSMHNTNRCCNQKMFNILTFGGSELEKPTKKVVEFNVYDSQTLKTLPSMTTQRHNSTAVFLKGEVYILGGYDSRYDWIRSVDKYSTVSKTWSKVTDMYDERDCFRVCAFMDKIYVVGGHIQTPATSSCLQFDTNKFEWKEVSRLNEARADAACAAFEGRIVVSGGTNPKNNPTQSNTAESYDVVADSWDASMPSMVERRSGHYLVVAKSKLFAIGGVSTVYKCEVLDKACNKFVTFNSPTFNSASSNFLSIKVFAVASKIFVLEDVFSVIHCYDIENDEWSEGMCEATEDISDFSCVKVPLF